MKVTKLGFFSRYKYRLDEEYQFRSKIFGYEIGLPYSSLTRDGVITLKMGYCWDGASGPTWDTKSCRRGSALHDVGYQWMGQELIPISYKEYIDEALLHDVCIEDGMNKWRAKIWLAGVKMFGGNHI